MAGLVEMFAAMASDHRDQPSAQDVKRTLRAISTRPGAGDLRRLDAHTEAALLRGAWQKFKIADVCSLTSDQAADCAHEALLTWDKKSGPVPVDALSLSLVRGLLEIRPGMPAKDRNAMVRDALLACKFTGGKKTIERLLTKARRAGG